MAMSTVHRRVLWKHSEDFGVGTLVFSYASPSLNHKRINIVRPVTPTNIDRLDRVNLNRTVLEQEIYTAYGGKLHLDDCIIANWTYDLSPTLETELKTLNNLVKVKELQVPGGLDILSSAVTSSAWPTGTVTYATTSTSTSYTQPQYSFVPPKNIGPTKARTGY